MTKFENLDGYNTNKFVTENHVLIKGIGTFYKTKEIAKKEFFSNNCVEFI